MAEKKHQRFHIRSVEQLRDEMERLQVKIPLSNSLDILSNTVEFDGNILPNRFVAQPMEGFDSSEKGAPRDLTFRRYRRYAAGGFGLIWMEATAVINEGRSNPGQLCINADTVNAFSELVAATRQAARQEHGRDVVIVMQLTHSGRYSKPAGFPQPLIAHHSPILDPLHNLPPDYPLVTDEYLDALQEDYVNAARLASEAGVDGVDIKSCHRYLVSELLASFTREGQYGGSFENRVRFLCEVVERIRQAVPGLFVTTRMNAFDAISYPYGFGVSREDYRIPDLDEPLRLAGMLHERGVRLLNISIGNPYYNPHFGRPFDFPISGMQPPAEHPLQGIARFMDITRRIQHAYPEMAVVGSGMSWLRQFMPYAAAGAIESGGAKLLGIGRGAFAYPDTPGDLLEKGKMDPAKCCVACSACTQIMRDGGKTGCVVRDSAIYGPQYRLGRRLALDHLLAEARRCRDCEEATCTKGCPARVDVPAFIKAFAVEDFRSAYMILRRSNALPEMCALVCPAEVQCEGACLECIFCEKPVPIRDIQLVTCRIARRAGWAGVDLPAVASGQRIAVAGGGPAGIAATIRLLELGHSVALYNKAKTLGGVPESIIPGERYDLGEGEIQAILAPALEAERLKIYTGQTLGGKVKLEDLRADNAAVVLAVGMSSGLSLGKAEGVYDALGFLAKAKSGEMTALPARVAVLGGGNTAMDAAVTALRLGAKDVYLVYRRSFQEMPAWPAERDNAMNAGCQFLMQTQPLGYETAVSGKLTGIRIARTELGAPDESGRRRPVVVPDSENVLAVDMVIEALGQKIAPEIMSVLEPLGCVENNRIAVEQESGACRGLPGVYAAGDLVNGGSTAVQGIAEGMRTAEAIHQELQAKRLPVISDVK